MKCVLIGDIGWWDLYHLGDEAMTEAAIDLLTERGVDEITLVAGDPKVSEKFYGLPAVKRLRFSGKWSRKRLDEELEKITRSFGRDDISETDKAVANADAVVIAGGGNMNSDHVHLLYERVGIARLAKHYGKRLFVTSQTVGPLLRAEDTPLVEEIIDYAECFGAREATTFKLALDLGGVPGRVVHTSDDAMMLSPQEKDYSAVKSLGLSDRYIVASFTSHAGSVGLSQEEYRSKIANTLDQLAIEFDADIALAPHAGSLDKSVVKRDQILNTDIQSRSTTGRVRALDMPTAREDIALTEGAILSLSTRYHPTVFGSRAKIPTVAISLSHYSSIRMRGSLGNVGLQRFVVPATDWDLVLEACRTAIERESSLREHLEPINEIRKNEQTRWWDAISASIKGDNWVFQENLASTPEFQIAEAWSEQVELLTPIFEKFAESQTIQGRLRSGLEESTKREKRVEDALVETRDELNKTRKLLRGLTQRAESAEARRAVRVADAVGATVRRFKMRRP